MILGIPPLELWMGQQMWVGFQKEGQLSQAEEGEERAASAESFRVCFLNRAGTGGAT